MTATQSSPPQAPAEAQEAIGLPTASALVVGSVIGTGVFALPASLAVFGPISLLSFGLVTVGALALALSYKSLVARTPLSGGPYVYARAAFGDFAGFLNAWSYWITAWAGNAAIVVAWVGYTEVFVNTGHDRTWSMVLALVGLWVPAVVNLAGLRSFAAFQVVTTVLKFIPLLFIATVGLLFVDLDNFGTFNASGESAWQAVGSAAAIALFSYLGIETASVVAGRVRSPERNVGRATVAGAIACAVVYLLGTFAVLGTVSREVLIASSAPFTDSADAIVGGEWAGNTVAVAAVVSGFGALVGWTLIVAQVPQSAARDGLFPQWFAAEDRRGVPAFGIVTSTLLASGLTLLSYTTFDSVFTTVVLLSVVTAVVPYIFSASADLYFLVRGRHRGGPHLVRDATVALVALAFSFWALSGSGDEAVFYGTFAILLGLPVYVWLRRDGEGVRP